MKYVLYSQEGGSCWWYAFRGPHPYVDELADRSKGSPVKFDTIEDAESEGRKLWQEWHNQWPEGLRWSREHDFLLVLPEGQPEELDTPTACRLAVGGDIEGAADCEPIRDSELELMSGDRVRWREGARPDHRVSPGDEGKVISDEDEDGEVLAVFPTAHSPQYGSFPGRLNGADLPRVRMARGRGLIAASTPRGSLRASPEPHGRIMRGLAHVLVVLPLVRHLQ